MVCPSAVKSSSEVVAEAANELLAAPTEDKGEDKAEVESCIV